MSEPDHHRHTAVGRWLRHARITDDPAGDLIADMRREADLPALFGNLEEMRSYLRGRNACREAMALRPDRVASLPQLA
jgi:hypothetical protein